MDLRTSSDSIPSSCADRDSVIDIDPTEVALVRGKDVECGHSMERIRKPGRRFMGHFFARRCILVVMAAVVIVALLMHSKGQGDSGRSGADQDGEIEDRSTVHVNLGGGVTMEFVLIPAGKFLMGSPKAEYGGGDSEGPQHEVEITRPFYLGKYEVTQQQYKQIMGKNPSWFSVDGEEKRAVAGLDTRRFPVEMVSWKDATAFCRKLSERDGKHRFHLPTEAEWEYACRAGTRTPFHFGTSLNGDKANCDGRFPYGTDKKGRHLGRPCPVGSYGVNAFGLYDMHGNVSEWCADLFESDYYNKRARKDPVGPLKSSLLRLMQGSPRVERGGHWGIDALFCRAAERGPLAPDSRYCCVGFRVAFRTD